MQLVSPEIRYKKSLLTALAEFKQDQDNNTSRQFYETYSTAENDFTDFVVLLRAQEKGEHLPKGYVPQTTYWLVDKDEFIGSISIRHQLTEFLLRIGGHIGYVIRPSQRNKGYGTLILKLALPKAKELGIAKVLITCDETNTASRAVIEANGGILENSVKQGGNLPLKLRFWITL